ncbi:MAG TPA: 2Fe-2S iron-sulfur cluster-binding protein [Sphingobium sp.]
MSGWRAGPGRSIDSLRPLRFTFDGKVYQGFAGDTLASALLANGVDLVARSFKYHRPRGIAAFGADEPNAVVRVGEGPRAEPNLKATQVMLIDGLAAFSQNRFPSLRFDLGAINDLIAPLLPAGFYYKTFMWPRRAWPLYEKWIRRAAGMGRAPDGADPDGYESRHTHTDLLVIGGGIAGLAAADSAAQAGRRVIVINDAAFFGGVMSTEPVEGLSHKAWVASVLSRLAANPAVTLMPRTIATGYYDDGLVMALEDVASPGPRLRRHLIVGEQIVLATGAFERPLLFANNDRPGVMLAESAHRYLVEHGVAAGRRAVLYANHDRAYAAALALHEAGVAICAVIDQRDAIPELLRAALEGAGIQLHAGGRVVNVRGRKRVTAAVIETAQAGGPITLACDLLLTSGGYSPATQLFTHTTGRLRWDEARDAFLPVTGSSPLIAIGAGAGEWGATDCVAAGRLVGAGQPSPEPRAITPMAKPVLPESDKAFVDPQNDVTTGSIRLAAREGYRRIEHAKRYTTLGMGTDQGRIAGLNGVAVLAQANGGTTGATGNSRPRPPFSPVSFGAMTGPFTGELLLPARTTPLDDWHQAHGATMANVGAWRRPQLYPRCGESQLAALIREASTVRRAVGIIDVGTLGKIDLQGPDVGRLLDFTYINGFSKLKPGACRYGVMLREDGIVLDDGTVTRLSEEHWFMTTGTGNAERVLAQLERVRQIDMPDLDVTITLVTDHWGAMAVAGPHARQMLQAMAPDFDCGNDSLPFMHMAEGHLAGIACRVLRVSFSGELAYEIYTVASCAPAMWEALLAAGEPFGIAPYGTEAMMTLRIEKGLFVPGFEADGRTLPDDLGVARMVSKTKDFIGRRSLRREAFVAPGRRQMVGIMTVDPAAEIPRGAQITGDRPGEGTTPMLGPVTSMAFSPELDRWIALALVVDGRSRIGTTAFAAAPLDRITVPVTICDPVFIDPEGTRLRG